MHAWYYRCLMKLLTWVTVLAGAASGAALMAAFAAGCSPEPQRAVAGPVDAGGPSFAIINANIWTGDPEQPWAEALAARGDQIVLVGSTADIRKAAGALQPVDAGGRLLLPGFIDSHVHFIDGGFRLASVQLRDARTREEFVARIKAFAGTLPPGSWITGGDWDHSLWGGELPARDWIDAVTPANPVWVARLDGHMALANTAALKAAGIAKSTPDVAGGTIVRDVNGEPTGVLKDNAMSLVDKVVPPSSAQMEDRALAAAMKYVAERGVTSIHNMGTWSQLATFARAHQAGTLSNANLRSRSTRGLGAASRRREQEGAWRLGWPRRRVAARRSPEGLRGRVARLAYGRVPSAVHGRAEGYGPAGEQARGSL
jgi:predicted amidohydrolase YtcJ